MRPSFARAFPVLLTLLAASTTALGQPPPDGGLLFGEGDDSEPGYRDGTLRGGLGFDMIDDEGFYVLELRPELTFGRLGLGFGIPLRFAVDGGELREEDWDTTSDYVGVIRYLRWGHKGDPLYARLGVQDNATLGHGSLVRHYTNAIDDDERRTGLVLDVDRSGGGVETLYSNLARTEILGARGYVRPLRVAGATTPVIERLELGASIVTDVDPNPASDDDESVTLTALDVGLPLVETSIFELGVYYDHASIADFGSGDIVGASSGLHFLGSSLDLGARLERRFLGEQFEIAYVDHFYEITRATKRESLAALPSRQGWFGELSASVVGTFHVLGSYEWWDENDAGWLHLETRLPDVIPRVRTGAAYDRYSTLGGLATLDDNSHFLAEAAYQLNSFVWLVGSFNRAWEQRDEDLWVDPEVPEYEPTDRTAVRLEFVWELPIG